MTASLADRLEGLRPRVLLTLGSGLNALADDLVDPVVVPFADVGLPEPTVPGHRGRFLAGTLEGVPVLAQQGRLHLYEGVPASAVAAAVRAAAACGVDTFLVTNAAGGIAADFMPGDLMLLTDHLNLTGTSPLLPPPGRAPEGPADVPHFLDLTGAYDPGLREAARAAADEAGERLVEGVYAGLVGPAYETPAEVSMLRTLGADAVGMSTVTEVIAARALGLRVAGLSLITNVHRPGGTPTDHVEVLDIGATAGPRLTSILGALLPRL
ncbi:MAG: purine-nucleoside phosphorylase [Nitriliruptorales bacterium]|nr:purine-nucleoside phosphorylase [Nitriliruptorales bacterium]